MQESYILYVLIENWQDLQAMVLVSYCHQKGLIGWPSKLFYPLCL